MECKYLKEQIVKLGLNQRYFLWHDLAQSAQKDAQFDAKNAEEIADIYDLPKPLVEKEVEFVRREFFNKA